MPYSPIAPDISQTLDIVQHLPSLVVLNLHASQFGRQLQQLLVGQLANLGTLVDVMFSHDLGGNHGTDAKEGCEAVGDEFGVGEMLGEDDGGLSRAVSKGSM
jgi:hypothetical protein